MAGSLEGRMFEVLTAAFTSCPVILEEPPIMATARVMTVADRLIAALEEFGLADDFLTEARHSILDNIVSMMSEPTKYEAWLDQISMQFTAEAKRRNLAQAVNQKPPP
jgi:hypothetical protein